MQPIGPVRLFATPTEQSYPLPANSRVLILGNRSDSSIRYAFVTGKVNDPSIAENPTFHEFETLGPKASHASEINLASGTLYYASNLDGAELHVTVFIA